EAAALTAVHGDGVAVGVEVLSRRRIGDGQVPGRGRQRRARDGERRRGAAGGHGDGARVLGADRAVLGAVRVLGRLTRRGERVPYATLFRSEAAALAAVYGDGVAVGVEVLPRRRRGDGQVPGRRRQRRAGNGERRRGAAGGHAHGAGVL